MSRWVSLLFTMGIISFWVTMTTQLVVREMEFRILNQYQRGVSAYLGNELRRESWMSIYHRHRKIGYTGYTIERTFEDEGVRHYMQLDSRVRFELAGKSLNLDVNGSVVTDLAMAPVSLDLDVLVEQGGLRLKGERDGKQFVLTGKIGPLNIPERRLPLSELCFSNGLALNLPVAGFEVGQSYQIPVFDPVTQQPAVAQVHVKERAERKYNGFFVDYFVLETRFLGVTYISWVTPEGQTLRQELPEPLGYILKREETRKQATRGFERHRDG